MRITGETTDVLEETLAVGGIHSSVLAVQGYYRIRATSLTERNNYFAVYIERRFTLEPTLRVGTSDLGKIIAIVALGVRINHSRRSRGSGGSSGKDRLPVLRLRTNTSRGRPVGIPLTDDELERRIGELGEEYREGLFDYLNDIGGFLALFGGPEEALSVWGFVDSGVFPDVGQWKQLEGPMANAVRSWMRRRDGGADPPGDELARRVAGDELASRRSLVADISQMGPDWDEPPLSTTPKGIFRRARMLAKPQADGAPSTTELEALALFRELLDQPEVPPPYGPTVFSGYDRRTALVLAADIAARHGLRDEATRLLRDWFGFVAAIRPNIRSHWDLDPAFMLPAVAGLICEGALADKIKLPPEARARLARDLMAKVAERLGRPDQSRWRHEFSTHGGEFFLQPLTCDDDIDYCDHDSFAKQQIASYPTEAYFFGPEPVILCDVQAEFATELPDLEGAIQAVSVPIDVEGDEGLYLRSVMAEEDLNKLDVPPGKYDVLVRFFPKKQDEEKGSRYQYGVSPIVLTFLPRGTVGPRVLKVAYGEVPESLVLHLDAHDIIRVPNE